MPMVETRIVRQDGTEVLIRRLDDDNRQYTEWDLDGNIIVGPDEPYTPEQNADADERIALYGRMYNEATLEDRARTALIKNAAWLNRTGTPTNLQTLDHIDLITKECSALIRMAIRALDTIEGT